MPVVKKRRRRKRNLVKGLKLSLIIIIMSVVVATIYCILIDSVPKFMLTVVRKKVQQEVVKAKAEVKKEIEKAKAEAKEDAMKKAQMQKIKNIKR